MSAERPDYNVLVIEDDPDMASIVRHSLVNEGFSVNWCQTGRQGLDHVRAEGADLIVLDVGLPDMEGTEVCRQLRSFTDAYVIMLTARGSEVDRIVGLSAGADDYVVKPFSPTELVLRVRAMLRRPRNGAAAATAGGSTQTTIGDLTIDEDTREVQVAGRDVSLTRLEFDLLAALVRERNVVLRRDRLVDLVWGPDWFGDTHLVDVHMSNLRKKLGDDAAAPVFVRSVRGVGFRLGPCTAQGAEQPS